MADVGDNKRPIIIKRKKVIAAGHHGGAWKVAYADFVTAMMAFFLLMWLLGATTEKQRKAIADYFNPTITINRNSGGGGSFFGGDSPFPEETLPHNGVGASNPLPEELKPSLGNNGVDQGEASKPAPSKTEASGAKAAEDKKLQEVQKILLGSGGESLLSDHTKRHIVSKISDEGLIVELFDIRGAPLFEYGTDTPTEVMQELVNSISRVFSLTTNQIAINGHLRTPPIVAREKQTWDISVDRSMRTRRMLEKSGTSQERIQRVTGFGSQKPTTVNPLDIRNNRVEVILLRSEKSLK
ncbi:MULTISPECIES: flagellar motor protein MotB [Halocynthiibacter]|uniref:OmpA family protein n=1 Tax=Halocynthiibacter halioticoli TaxID=2986804 RepID=A0AAE3J4K5_9RHOB|nr:MULTISPECIES: flagellar motor protein MotB [Halocynthiibacter]MCV6825842.1 OmpA family protein [Halocynthiibacter halioticoli]MCW4058843.1 OmpA family protein [Halocynthiibacter sp. SDUM655004]